MRCHVRGFRPARGVYVRKYWLFSSVRISAKVSESLRIDPMKYDRPPVFSARRSRKTFRVSDSFAPYATE